MTQTMKPKAKPSLLIVYTGNGKGKTTAALGLAFRALGRKRRVAIVQFIKGKWETGERLFAETLKDLDFHVMGLGFTWESDDLDQDKAAAQAAWQTAQAFIAKGEHDGRRHPRRTDLHPPLRLPRARRGGRDAP